MVQLYKLCKRSCTLTVLINIAKTSTVSHREKHQFYLYLSVLIYKAVCLYVSKYLFVTSKLCSHTVYPTHNIYFHSA